MESCTYIAAFLNDTREMQRAFDDGQEINPLNEDGLAPLHIAAANGNLTIIKTLSEYGVPLDQKDMTGCTALHLAARNGHLDTVKWLVSNGCDTKAESNKGSTALDVAFAQSDRQGQRNVVAFLKRCGREKMSWETTHD